MHLHADGSLHLALDPVDHAAFLASGWVRHQRAGPHPRPCLRRHRRLVRRPPVPGHHRPSGV
ncbi:luciferase domain-containing protein [Streptomyces sp. NPDC001340]